MTDYISLLIRFNWPHPIWDNRPDTEYGAWLARRLELFDVLTARSLLNLYERPDCIFILIDPGRDMGLDIEGRISHALRRIKSDIQFIPFEPNKVLGALLRERISWKADLKTLDRIVTTRLDSDDLISSSFFAKLRACLRNISSENAIISFPGGCNYVKRDHRFFFSSYMENPFLSLVEPATDALSTVFFKMHTEIMHEKIKAYAIRSNQPDWASVIHSENLANHALASNNNISLDDTDKLAKIFGLSR